MDFAGRLRVAIDAKGVSRSRVGRESGLREGYIFRLLGDSPKSKQILAPGPEVIRQLADYLGVAYEWLAIGRGPMRGADWAPSPLEEAMLFARRHGTRQDAIDDAIARHRDDEELTAIDWILAFDASARRLERSGVPRPEEVARGQRVVSRLANKRARLMAELAALDAREAKPRPPEAAPKKRTTRRS